MPRCWLCRHDTCHLGRRAVAGHGLCRATGHAAPPDCDLLLLPTRARPAPRPGSRPPPLLGVVRSTTVATARYLLRLYGDAPLDITYVGNCPSASSDPADRPPAPPRRLLCVARSTRDRRCTGAPRLQLLFRTRSPTLRLTPRRAPDRSRAPGRHGRRRQWDRRGNGGSALPLVPRSVVDVRDVEYAAELAQYLITGAPVLLDLAPRLGCACSGAVSGVAASSARAVVMALEPPRSPGPVVETDLQIDLDLPLKIDEVPEPVARMVAVDRAPADGPAKRPAEREVEWQRGIAVAAERAPGTGAAPPTLGPGCYVDGLVACLLRAGRTRSSRVRTAAQGPSPGTVTGMNRSARVP